MTAQIAGFVTREAAGLRPPRSVSRNITPKNGGVAPHYGGGPQKAAEPDADHDLCIKTWLAWQNYHMRVHGWADIAYTGGVCNHGYAFAGRGAGIRTAANGTNAGNQNYYAVTWIGGVGQTPTPEALDAMDWWIEQLRGSGAGRGVKPHSFFKATGCPGDPLRHYAITRDGKIDLNGPLPTPEPAPVPVKPVTAPNPQVQNIQRALRVSPDGKWGPQTDLRLTRMRVASRAKRGWPSNHSGGFDVKDVQKVIGTTVDGIWGPLSQAALTVWIKGFQKVIGVTSDGYWGPKTDGRVIALRRRHLNNY